MSMLYQWHEYYLSQAANHSQPMTQLTTGIYFGKTTKVVKTADVILSQVVYQAEQVDWHYHENAFFSFVLQGELTERTTKATYHCPAGSLLFQQWDEKHHNTSSRKHSSFYVEIKKDWFEKGAVDAQAFQGHFQLTNPAVKILFHRIYREAQHGDALSQLALEELLIQVFDLLKQGQTSEDRRVPGWVFLLTEMLRELPEEKLTLDALSAQLNIHPGHICRYFRKQFHCTLSEYLRQIRVERALQLLRTSSCSLTEIAFRCGFADQSHFNRCFKAISGLTPYQYRTLLAHK